MDRVRFYVGVGIKRKLWRLEDQFSAEIKKHSLLIVEVNPSGLRRHQRGVSGAVRIRL